MSSADEPPTHGQMSPQMNRRATRSWSGHSGAAIHQDLPTPASVRGNRRRLRVFLVTLVFALALSLGYTFLRPVEYRATSRLEISPAIVAETAGGPSPHIADGASESRKPFLTDVEVLTSRPVLEQAVSRLESAGHELSALGPDPIANIQSHLQAIPISNTNVVELVVTGSDAELTALLLNAIVDRYRDRIARDYRGSSSEVIAGADEEAGKLAATVAAKRRDVESFRLRHNIVSLERGENEVLARVRNLSATLGTANDRVAAAEGKLRSLRESTAAGKSVVRARDDPTLANLEQRASQAREDLQDLERTYTSDYLAKDPRAVTLRTRIAELDRQVKVQRETGQQAALLEAEQDLSSAQEAARRIQVQIASDRQQVGEFTAAFNEYKSRQDELAELESAYRAAAQRKAKLEASEGARMPSIRVLEAAVTPQQPWRPLYWRDAAIGGAGSLVLALLAMWLVELFNRSTPQPALVIAQSLGALPSTQPAPPFLMRVGAQDAALAADAIPLLPRQAVLPRELDREEVTAIIGAGDDSDRIAMLLLFAGVSPDELVQLRWTDVDLVQRLLRVNGESTREVALSDLLHGLLSVQPAPQGTALLVGALVRAGTRDNIDARILCAAHDAGLESAAEVTSDCLRHTYIAFLVRQRIRFADLTRIVGPLSLETLGLYSALSPSGLRAARDEIDLVLPAVRKFGSE